MTPTLTLTPALAMRFNPPDLGQPIGALRDDELNAQPFGVIGSDDGGLVRASNHLESVAAGLAPQRVPGHALYTVVAPCMNNFRVAQRFDDAAADGSGLHATIDCVLSGRRRPVKVKLRRLAVPGQALRHVLLQRSA